MALLVFHGMFITTPVGAHQRIALDRTSGAVYINGIAFGFGSVLGATIVVYFVFLVLSQLEFIPIIGDMASQIIAEINATKSDSKQ